MTPLWNTLGACALLFAVFVACLFFGAIGLTWFAVRVLDWTWLLVCDSERGIWTVCCVMFAAFSGWLTWTNRK